MQYFLDTTGTIPAGVGFAQFGGLHIGWLILFVAVTVVNCMWYKKLSDQGKAHWKKAVAILLLLDELFKMAMLAIGGRYTVDYLPLHLCSINIFMILIHAFKPFKVLGVFLYTVCIPGALAALLFPSWTALPLGNFMHLHSFTVHILLALYPIVLFTTGELVPSFKDLPKCLLLLVIMAIPIYGVNLLLNTNFMFLMQADPGNPLLLFEELWGNHLYGYPVIIAGVIVVLYLPLCIYRKIKKHPI